MKKIGFDSEKYLKLQSEKILQRINQFGGKLYIEFGGKLFDDFHASRVLPGFAPDNKIKMLSKLKDDAEIVIAVSALDIAKNKIRADYGITYEQDVLRLIKIFKSYGLYVGSVVITKFTEDNQQAKTYQAKLEKLGIKVYRHYPIPGYPTNPEFIVSDAGYGKNDFIETTKKLVIVTAPGPGSGKMATCLSQLYHENKRGNKVGYAKYETFPVWNLPLNHPVNVAYEAATADLNDINMIDPWHLAAYGETTVNYNRDVEVFPVLNAIFQKILGESPYKSPTDMGVNMVGFAISDDEVVRRYYKALDNERRNNLDANESDKIKLIMNKSGIDVNIRKVVKEANEYAEKTGTPCAAIELDDGTIVKGKTSELLGCSAGMILHALKRLAGIDPELDIISRDSLRPIQTLKTEYLGSKNPRLHIDEALIALSSSAASDKNAKKALEQLPKLKGCEVHTTVLLSKNDITMFRKLGVNLTSEPVFEDKQ